MATHVLLNGSTFFLYQKKPDMQREKEKKRRIVEQESGQRDFAFFAQTKTGANNEPALHQGLLRV